MRLLCKGLKIVRTGAVGPLARAVLALALLPFFFPISADPPKTTARAQLDTLRDEVRAAHARGDGPAYLAGSQKMRQLLNDSPNGMLQVMSAQAFAGDSGGALDSFAAFVRMGQSNRQVFEAKSFDALRSSPRYLALQTEMAKNDDAIAAASAVFRMPEPGMVPEDIDYDPTTRKFYITSVMNHAVLACDNDGGCRVFLRAPDPWPMMALKVDSHRRTLWATAVALKGFKSVPKASWGTSLVLLYDLDSGKLLHRVPGPAGATLGDMTLTPDGDAIIADNEGGLYRLNRKTLLFDRLDGGEFISPQTPAMCPDQRCVFVPDYVRGIAILDLETRQVSWLPSEWTSRPERHRWLVSPWPHPRRYPERNNTGAGGALHIGPDPEARRVGVNHRARHAHARRPDPRSHREQHVLLHCQLRMGSAGRRWHSQIQDYAFEAAADARRPASE